MVVSLLSSVVAHPGARRRDGMPIMHHMLRCAINLRNHAAAQNTFFPALALSSSFAAMMWACAALAHRTGCRVRSDASGL
jgi:hypothetical protein